MIWKAMEIRSPKGFTLVELLVVIAVIAILAVQLLGVQAMSGKNVRREQCVANIKQIDLAFAVWGAEHGNQYPTAVSTVAGGSQEKIVNRNLLNYAATYSYGVTNVFFVMSNLLRSPLVLYCPADQSTNSALHVLVTGTTNWASFGSGNLSYFVDGDAAPAYPKMILVGDRNIGNVINGVAGAAALPNWGVLPADSMFPGNHAYASLASVGATTKPFPWTWSDGDLHQDSGNLGMADGSVNQTSLSGLVKPINDTATNSIPGYTKMIINMP
jgi:prepilin-type N-terminal cleavage/methylation domain-containing protein